MARPNNGPRLDRNPRGLYEIRWTEKDQRGQSRSKRLSTGTASIQEAQKVFAGWLTEYQRDEGKTAPTVQTILGQYLDERGHKMADLERQTDAARMIAMGLGNLALDEVDDLALARYKKRRMDGSIRGKRRRCTSEATLRRELSCFKAACNYAHARHRITKDQVPYVDLPQSSPAANFFLVEQEVDDLLRYARKRTDEKGRLSRTYRYLALGLGTAARMNSILNLTWHRVDLQARLIRYDLDASGRRTGGDTKKRRVPVPIADWLMPDLKRAYQEKTSEFVLDSNIQIRRQMDKLCNEAADELGNPRFRKLNRHALRHTAATLMARAGVDIWKLAGVLGDTMATVQNNYLHHHPDHLRSAVNFRAPDSGESGQTANDEG
jgi:integrase